MATRPAWLSDELFPFESRWVEAHGTRLHHVDEGDASLPTLLLVHGNPTWSFLYREIVLGLRDRFRCVAVDLPGFGLSAPPEGFRFTPLEHALALERFVLELDLDDVTLLTQDWGGPTGFAVAGWHPDRFAAFVVGNTWAWPMDKRGTGTWSAFFSSPLGSRLMRDQAVQRGSRRRTLTDEEVAHFRRPARLDAVKGLARGVSGSGPFLAEVERGLPALADRPALLVWPDRDVAFGEAERRRWEAVFPDHTTVPLEGAGHFITEDAPEEIVAAVRDRFG